MRVHFWASKPGLGRNPGSWIGTVARVVPVFLSLDPFTRRTGDHTMCDVVHVVGAEWIVESMAERFDHALMVQRCMIAPSSTD